MSLQPLHRLRRQLIAWYAVTLGVILSVLGVSLYLTIRHQMAAQLDTSLRAATTELAGAARIRDLESRSATGAVVDAVDELHIPQRTLYLMTAAGGPIRPDTADAWVRAAAARSGAEGPIDDQRLGETGETFRLHAERFALDDGAPLVAVAVASQVELEQEYGALIATFLGAALGALVLVAAAGWLLVRKSTEPVERGIEHMRRFMADAAHELRTPITVLRGRAEVALALPRDGATYVAALRGIEAESQRLGRIVDDLLTLARVDAGERSVARERLYLDDLALDAADAARVVAGGRGVELLMDEFEEAVVDGDGPLLRQLLMILLDNAVKFTPEGGRVHVRVRTEHAHPVISVEDTGVGIPADHLPRIFERFYRADPARTPVRSAAGMDGAGLGLAIARWIADAHGATIRIASEPGRGTQVLVEFPEAAPRAASAAV